MNIVFINHYATVGNGIGGTRHYDISRSLVDMGHNVTIVASSFNHSIRSETVNYDGKKYLEEMHSGVRVIWMNTIGYRENGLLRIFAMLHFMFLCIWHRSIISCKADVVVGSSVHLFAVLAGYILASRRGIPFVYEVRDLWPQTLIDMGVSRFHPFVLMMGFLDKYIRERAHAIVVLMPGAVDYYVGVGVPESKLMWISNGVDLERHDLTNKPSTRLQGGEFKVVYAGSMGVANNLDMLVDAAMSLPQDSGITVHMVGDGPQKKSLEDRCRGIGSVIFHEPVTKNIIPEILAQADLVYVGLKDIPLYKHGMSMNKLFDYMAAAKPILFAGCAKGNPVELAGCGDIVCPPNVSEIGGIMRMYQSMSAIQRNKYGQNGRCYVEEHFDTKMLAKKYVALLLSLSP